MQTLSAKEAQKIVKETKMNAKLLRENTTTQMLNDYISQINELINTAAKGTKISVSIKASWDPKFDKKLKKYYKSFGYAVSFSSYSGCRFLSLSWHPCWFRRIFDVLK